MSPPRLTSHNLLATASGRRQAKAARRDLLVQCERCGVSGTGRVNGFGRWSSVNLPVVFGAVLRHKDCGGAMRAFDLESAV